MTKSLRSAFQCAVCFVFSISMASLSFAESISLTTYYPAPFGAYDTIQLVPRTVAPTCDDNSLGGLYMDTTQTLRACVDKGAGVYSWDPLTVVWAKNGNSIYPTDTLTNGNIAVGIGMTNPPSRLSVAGDGTGIVQIGRSGCNGDYAGITLGRTTAPAACDEYSILSSSTDRTLYLNRPSGFEMHFRKNNATQMYITDDGRVGIGNVVQPNLIGWPASLSVNGEIHSPRYYDDDPNFYIDSNTTSFMNTISATGSIGASGEIYACGAGACSHLRNGGGANYLRGPTYFNNLLYDENDPTNNFYLDPNGTSRMNDIYASIIHDISDSTWYLDPNGTSNLNTVYTTDVHSATGNKWLSQAITTISGPYTVAAGNGQPSPAGLNLGVQTFCSLVTVEKVSYLAPSSRASGQNTCAVYPIVGGEWYLYAYVETPNISWSTHTNCSAYCLK